MQMGDQPVADADSSRARFLEAGDQIEGRTFAATGGSDEYQKFAILGREAQAVDRRHTPESLGQIFDDQLGHADVSSTNGAVRPPLLYRTDRHA
jgi:hypothetical protein